MVLLTSYDWCPFLVWVLWCAAGQPIDFRGVTDGAHGSRFKTVHSAGLVLADATFLVSMAVILAPTWKFVYPT